MEQTGEREWATHLSGDGCTLFAHTLELCQQVKAVVDRDGTCTWIGHKWVAGFSTFRAWASSCMGPAHRAAISYLQSTSKQTASARCQMPSTSSLGTELSELSRCSCPMGDATACIVRTELDLLCGCVHGDAAQCVVRRRRALTGTSRGTAALMVRAMPPPAQHTLRRMTLAGCPSASLRGIKRISCAHATKILAS